jgi:hypothetical protein
LGVGSWELGVGSERPGTWVTNQSSDMGNS